MNAHPDFSSSSASATSPDEVTTDLPADELTPFFPPEFEYLVPASARYVLVLDRTQTSAQSVSLLNDKPPHSIVDILTDSIHHQNRWSLIRRSLYRWIHALPDETYLSVVISSGGESSPTLPWTRVTADNRDGLLGRIPRRPVISSSASQPASPSAIQLAHQVGYKLLRNRVVMMAALHFVCHCNAFWWLCNNCKSVVPNEPFVFPPTCLQLRK